ncbi:MAG: heavy metal sensor histidine kinase [Betaproteobacteria bacterium]|nr:heavy metal sensor histidine kinase [Betaproteobacteria bacterium]
MNGPLSLRTRIALLFALSVTAALLLASRWFAYVGNARLLADARQELCGKVAWAQAMLRAVHTPEDWARLEARAPDIRYGQPGMAFLITDRGSVRDAFGAKPEIRRLAAIPPGAKATPATLTVGSRVLLVAAARMPVGIPGARPVRVAIGLDITHDRLFSHHFERTIDITILALGMALGGLGWLVARRGLSPIKAVSSRMAALSARTLDQPLASAPVPREMEELVRAFELMRTHLHDAFRRLTQFSDDLAHELRTPLSNCLLQTQVTLDGAADLQRYRAALQANEEECQRLSRMMADMLFMAKADNRLEKPRCEALDLAAEVAALFEFYDAQAAEQGVRLTLTGHARLQADKLMLRRAISNLLSNALAFTARGDAIRVHMETSDDGFAVLGVTNPGPEIPEAEQARIFERLYRADAARQNNASDHLGLGLAITRSIVELHGGAIGVSCRNGHTTFTMRLPALCGEAPAGA